ncbi:MAG: prepilin-type N-terminal cleavage/methylation domain-containing protein [Nitrospinales bacterium]
MSNKNLNENGFSLLEVIVALSIMAVGFVTVLQLFSGSIKSVELSDQYLKGISFAHQKMGYLELENFEIEEYSGFFKDDENFTWTLDIEPYESTLNDEIANINIVQVALNVSWNDADQERNFELVTLRTVGRNYPSTNAVILGTEKGGIYGKNNRGGVAGGTSSDTGSDLVSPNESSSSDSGTQNISGLGTGGQTVSGFGQKTNISGFSQ